MMIILLLQLSKHFLWFLFFFFFFWYVVEPSELRNSPWPWPFVWLLLPIRKQTITQESISKWATKGRYSIHDALETPIQNPRIIRTQWDDGARARWHWHPHTTLYIVYIIRIPSSVVRLTLIPACSLTCLNTRYSCECTRIDGRSLCSRNPSPAGGSGMGPSKIPANFYKKQPQRPWLGKLFNFAIFLLC